MPIIRKSKKKISSKQLKSPGVTGWLVIFLSIFIVVFLVSMFLPRSEVSLTKSAPKIIRLQLLNGCGISGAAETIAKAFMESSSEVFFDVIDKSNAKLSNFEHTIILDRKGNKGDNSSFSNAALYVAELTKVGQDQLLIQKLTDNLLDIDVTVIIGNDYLSLTKILNEVK